MLTPDGGLDDARFGGGTQFVDGTTTASAADARYLVTKGHLELSGKIGPLPPQVQDERITVVATKIDLTFDGPKMLANGDVQSVMKPSKKHGSGRSSGARRVKGSTRSREPGRRASQKAGGAGDAPRGNLPKPAKPEPKTPGMLKDDQPAYVTANALNYDGDADKAIYTGSSRLWQGDTAVSADTITIDEKTGDLFASRNVRSTQVCSRPTSSRRSRRRCRRSRRPMTCTTRTRCIATRTRSTRT